MLLNNQFWKVKLAIQLLQSGANIKKESEEIVNLDEGVPDEGEVVRSDACLNWI